MKTESCKLYSRDFWIFLPNNIKIDRYNFELYRFKAGPFFETQCMKLRCRLRNQAGLLVINVEVTSRIAYSAGYRGRTFSCFATRYTGHGN